VTPFWDPLILASGTFVWLSGWPVGGSEDSVRVMHHAWCSARSPRRSGFFYRPSTDTGKPETRYPVTVVHAYRYELVLPFPAIVLNQRLACYRSTRYAATRQLRSSVLTARANQLHRGYAYAAGLRSCRRSARFKQNFTQMLKLVLKVT
jgi:hypothetical protein